MSTVKKPVILDETGKAIANAISEVANAVKSGTSGHIYGFIIDGNESNPSAAVSYTDDAVGLTPAHMDFTNNVFDYGSWKDAFFMPRPCMLKSNGTVDYYLQENDFYQKLLSQSYNDFFLTYYPLFFYECYLNQLNKNKFHIFQ